jgi:hypothetical protein
MRVARRFFLRELLQRHRAKRMRRGATPDGSPLEVGPAEQLGAGSRASLAPTESLMAKLYESLTQMQRREIYFDWDYRDAERGLLRTFIANHWQVTQPCIRSKFFTRQQRAAIRDLFKSLLDPAWHDRFFRQSRDDTKGHPWGADQSIAFFGSPADGPFQFLITGRHLTLRCEARSGGRVAFGGPIMYGHAASAYAEPPGHPGNIFWRQAERASQVYEMLDGGQREQAVLSELPEECAIGFRSKRPGLPVELFTRQQRAGLGRLLDALVEPFRAADRQRVRECLARQGGLERCNLTFYREGRVSAPQWDNWRLEGPSFVWYFRGSPHVHAWVHVAADATQEVNARTGAFLFPNHDPLV